MDVKKTPLMERFLSPWLAALAALGVLRADPLPPTVCNPLDLPYRFQLDSSYREAADPTAIYFHGEYWIFASKTGGYWHSSDFVHWTLIEPTGLPLESWAPTVEKIGDRLYFCTTGSGIFTTDDPAKGKWTPVSQGLDVGQDSDLFLDDDGRLYLYTGCSDRNPIRGVELDLRNGFRPIGSLTPLIAADPLHRGWEARHSIAEATDTGGHNAPWFEGGWMTRADGRYYLQYAAPGTEFETYGDGVFVSDHPLGPFTYQGYSPVSFKPTGFARGAGHGSTFRDAKGNYWHIATIALSRRNMFERRIGVYPVRFFPDGQMACNTYMGDYPQYSPGTVADPFASNSPGWMLLSLDKPAVASSSLPDFPARQAFDENLRDWWSAATGNPGEWLQVDLLKTCRINALQVNFADQDATQLDRLRNDGYRYLIEVSDDATHWRTLLDRRDTTRDAPHDYAQLDAPVMGRYVRITNVHMPANARFSISGLRLFGNGLGAAPAAVRDISAVRNPADSRAAHLSWTPLRRRRFLHRAIRHQARPALFQLSGLRKRERRYQRSQFQCGLLFHGRCDQRQRHRRRNKDNSRARRDETAPADRVADGAGDSGSSHAVGSVNTKERSPFFFGEAFCKEGWLRAVSRNPARVASIQPRVGVATPTRGQLRRQPNPVWVEAPARRCSTV